MEQVVLFVIWGFIHALLFLPLIYGKRVKYRHVVAKGKKLPSLKELYLMLRVFFTFALTGIFFIASGTLQAVEMYKIMLSPSFFTMPKLPPLLSVFFCVLLIIIEWIQREKNYGLELHKDELSLPARWFIYFLVVFTILVLGAKNPSFIYFQF